MAAVQIRVGQLLSTSRATQATRRSCCRAAMQCCKYGAAVQMQGSALGPLPSEAPSSLF